MSSIFGLCAFRRSPNSAMLGQSIQRFTTSLVHRSQRRICHFQWWLLVMITLYFGSGFAAPFFIVRHQLLKKQGCFT
ncbi:cytochrome c oxidase subunit 7C, mitochondrial-like [Rhinolophus ferrumequinum]|uniref:cytochrome c oxidase subunit 7C, mitochondrial-like n=1 Tax=Rhinolophus ferrumequinum TaxID=59479 RepID=UPI00140FC3EB|nr:cytochrome c oxidase subunit 7C, mitochondrial-like [Rhinolophus ferrumequinum]